MGVQVKQSQRATRKGSKKKRKEIGLEIALEIALEALRAYQIEGASVIMVQHMPDENMPLRGTMIFMPGVWPDATGKLVNHTGNATGSSAGSATGKGASNE